MDKTKLIENMGEVIRSLREQLDSNDTSTFANIGNSVKLAFQSAKASLSGSAQEKRILETFKEHMERFEMALERGSREEASRILDTMNKDIQDLATKTEVKPTEPRSYRSQL